MTEHPNRAEYVVDWDDTCVHEFDERGRLYWPDMGPWMDGAVEGLRWLSARGKTVIFSLRCHPYEPDDSTRRRPGLSEEQARKIRAMLDAEGLHDIEVYPCDRGKPPGRFYIDNAGLRHISWERTQLEVEEREHRSMRDRVIYGPK